MAERVGFDSRTRNTAEILGFSHPETDLGVTVRGKVGKSHPHMNPIPDNASGVAHQLD